LNIFAREKGAATRRQALRDEISAEVLYRAELLQDRAERALRF
jgi:hypothetical protein